MATEEGGILKEIVRISTQPDEVTRAEYGLSQKQVLRVLKQVLFREMKDMAEGLQLVHDGTGSAQIVPTRAKRDRRPSSEPEPHDA